jgi:ribosomal protein S18 acetylase RimI-like enzyme
MTIEVRAFAPTDYAAALHLWQQTPGVGLSEADSRDNIALFLERNPGSSFVAREGDAVVATILCGHDGRRGLIHHLAVAPAWRHQGLGRRLVQLGLAALKGAGIQKCHLVMFRDNADARAFWSRLGAEERVSLALFSIATTDG